MMHGWLPSLIPGPGTSACMGRILSRWCRKFPIHFSSLSFFVRPGSPFLRPDPHIRIAGARKKRSRMGALAPTEGSSLRASSTTAHLSVSAMTTSEGSCGLVHEASCHVLLCGGPKAQTMMQGYASAASSEAADPFLTTALKPSGSAGHRHLEPSSATRQKRATGAETVRCSLTAVLL